MLSLLLGFAQAHVKHTACKHEGQVVSEKPFFLDPKEMQPFISKDPRYIKVYRANETAVANGGGVTKAFISNNVAYVYLNNDHANAISFGASVASIVGTIIPGPVITKVAAIICGWSGAIIRGANRGRGVVIRVPLGFGFPSIYPQ